MSISGALGSRPLEEFVSSVDIRQMKTVIRNLAHDTKNFLNEEKYRMIAEEVFRSMLPKEKISQFIKERLAVLRAQLELERAKKMNEKRDKYRSFCNTPLLKVIKTNRQQLHGRAKRLNKQPKPGK